MKVDFINPFYMAALEVLNAETGVPFRKGNLSLDYSDRTGGDMAVLIGVVGKVKGVVIFQLERSTARNIASAMMGKELPLHGPLTDSAMAELANMISGRSSMRLEEAGYPCDISPPTVVSGKGVIISTDRVPQLHVPFESSLGTFEIVIALRE